MNWQIDDIEKAINRAERQIAPVADVIANDLNISKKDDLFIVGGFVRDNMLAGLTSKGNVSKDLDLMLQQRPSFENNSNILWWRKNSLGGIKLGTKSFPEIDIFQQNVSNPQLLVGEIFDFNCNALYYSHLKKQIFPSVYFYGFLSNKTIDFENYIINKHGIETRYSPYSMVSRALKFQIQFKEKYAIDAKLSSNILYVLNNLDKDMEQKMFDYTKRKAKSEILKDEIISEYKRLRYK